MRFLAPLDTELQVGDGVSDEKQLPAPVIACRDRRRQLCLDNSEFFSSVTPRKGGRPDCAGKHELHHFHITHRDNAGGGEKKKPTVELGNLARSQLLDRTYEGEYFAYLLTKSEPGRTNSHVGWSTNPLRDVCQLNARQQASASGDGGWELAAVVAAFSCPEWAADFGQALVTGTRGYVSKLEKIPVLAAQNNKRLYIYKQQPQEPLAELLEHYSEPVFTDLYKSLSARL